jgi:hypothetical protein
LQCESNRNEMHRDRPSTPHFGSERRLGAPERSACHPAQGIAFTAPADTLDRRLPRSGT